MKLHKTSLLGVHLVEMEPHRDERGFFARAFSAREFAAAGLESHLTEVSVSYCSKKGTLRGVHFQNPPHEEAKLVRVTAGKIWDVVVDLRKDTPDYLRWEGFELSSENRLSLYIPKGFAHGYLSLEDQTEVEYHITDTFMPASVSGFCWNDPKVMIDWPLQPKILSEKDQNWRPL